MELLKQDLILEQWRYISNSDRYYISNLGRVKRIGMSKEWFIKPFRKATGKGSNRKTLYVKIKYLDGKTIMKPVHVFVYEAFVGSYNKHTHAVFHRNLSHDDNRLFNLELISRKKLGVRTGGNTKKKKGIYKLQGNVVVNYYGSSREAAADNFCSYQTILDSCNKKTKRNCTDGYYVWANVIDNDIFAKDKYEFNW